MNEAPEEKHIPPSTDSDEEVKTDTTDLYEGEMTLLAHLTELRSRLIKSVIAIFIGFAATFYFAEDIYRFLSDPLVTILKEQESKMIFTSLPEVFFVYIKTALFSGIIVALPVLFYQFWKFVAPGLYKNERKYIIPFVLFSTIFFLIGAGFCYYQIFPIAFKFFIGFQDSDKEAMITLKEYLKFSTRLLLAFGLIFEMPIVCLFLSKLGIVTPQFLRKNRKYAILAMVIIAAILTPPDVVTQLMMAGPMLVLYEFSIWVAVVFGRKPPPPLTDAE